MSFCTEQGALLTIRCERIESSVGNGRCSVPCRMAKLFEFSTPRQRGTLRRAFPTSSSTISSHLPSHWGKGRPSTDGRSERRSVKQNDLHNCHDYLPTAIETAQCAFSSLSFATTSSAAVDVLIFLSMKTILLSFPM
jgi:hypothetical protein